MSAKEKGKFEDVAKAAQAGYKRKENVYPAKVGAEKKFRIPVHPRGLLQPFFFLFRASSKKQRRTSLQRHWWRCKETGRNVE